MSKAIGGYFELELRRGEHYHKDALRLNTARNCFEYILLARKYKKVYIPYFTCEVMLQPLLRHQVNYEFYHIGMNLEPREIVDLKPGEAFLYTNYFGLKQSCVERLAEIYHSQLIVDNAQAFFAPRIEGIDTFYSPRKFFGVPDGGYLYTDCLLEQNFSQYKSFGRMKHLLRRIDEGAEAGYADFRQNDDALDDNPIREMSELTARLLENADYKAASERRRINFKCLHGLLGAKNQMCFGDLSDDVVPMTYPYYVEEGQFLKLRLIKNRIFVPTYWANVKEWCKDDTCEYALANHLCNLPIDQRYADSEMNDLINMINK